VEYRKKQELIAMQKIEVEQFEQKLRQEITVSVGLHVRDWFRRDSFHCYIVYFKNAITPEEFLRRLRKGFGEVGIGFKDLEEKEEKET